MSANETDYRTIIDKEITELTNTELTNSKALKPAVQELTRFLDAALEKGVIEEIVESQFVPGKDNRSYKIRFNFAGYAARENAFVESKKPNAMKVDASISVRRVNAMENEGEFIFQLSTSVRTPEHKVQRVNNPISSEEIVKIFSRYTKNLIALKKFYEKKTAELAPAQKTEASELKLTV